MQQGTIGTGQVFQTSFNVPSASIEFWKNRLVANGVEYEEIDRFGTLILEFRDPSGLLLAITPNDEDDRQPLWFLPEIGEKERHRWHSQCYPATQQSRRSNSVP